MRLLPNRRQWCGATPAATYRTAPLLLICLAAWLPLSASFAATAEAPAQPGTIEFSDGTTLAGRISLPAGKDFVLHAPNQLWNIPLAQVGEIYFFPSKEEMERAWRFKEAGRTQKEFSGEPYPVRHLKATVITRDGRELTGHLYTAALLVETTNQTQKLVLYAKQRGQPGESLETLVYPAKISLAGRADTESREDDLIVNLDAAGRPAAELAALTEVTLLRLAARPGARPGQYTVTRLFDQKLFLAVKEGNVIYVGWDPAADTQLAAKCEQALADAQDFFDRRELLGCYFAEATGDVYTLIMFSRQGGTTLGGERTQPWRLGIWRWKFDPGNERMLLAGRGDFFRGIVAKSGADLPAVVLTDKLWAIGQDGADLTEASE